MTILFKIMIGLYMTSVLIVAIFLSETVLCTYRVAYYWI